MVTVQYSLSRLRSFEVYPPREYQFGSGSQELEPLGLALQIKEPSNTLMQWPAWVIGMTCLANIQCVKKPTPPLQDLKSYGYSKIYICNMYIIYGFP